MQFSENKTFSLTYNNKVRFILVKRLLSDRINVLEYDITKPQLGGTFKTYLLSKCKNIKKANFVVPSEDFESFSDNGSSDDDLNEPEIIADDNVYTFTYTKWTGNVSERKLRVKKVTDAYVEGIDEEDNHYKVFIKEKMSNISKVSLPKTVERIEEKEEKIVIPQDDLEANWTEKCQLLKPAVSEEKEMLDGEYTTWYNNGMIKEKRKYIKGKLMTETIWDENGSVIKKKTSLTTSDFYYNYEVGKKYRIVYWPINDVEQTQEKVVTVKAIESKFLRVTYDGQEHNVKKLLRNRCQFINIESNLNVVDNRPNELIQKHENEIKKSFINIQKELSVMANSIKQLQLLNVNVEQFNEALRLINGMPKL